MVKYATPLTFGPGLTDKHQSIDLVRMRGERAAKARATLKKHGIPTILASSEPNVRYLLGVSWGAFQENLFYTLFFAEGDPLLFAHAGSYQMKEIVPWIKDWRPARATVGDIAGPAAVKKEYQLFARDIHAELEARGLAGEPLAVCDFEEKALVALRETGLTVVDGYPLLLEASQCKTEDEINCLKLAATFCTVGWQKFTEVAKPGMSTAAVNRLVHNAMADAGAEPWGWVFSGPTTFERLVTPINRIIEYGDLCYYPLCGTSYLGYTACSYRTFKIGGKPSDKEKDWYKRIKDTLDANIEATRIGNTTADAAKPYPPASKWGYKDEVEILTIEFGHGIGLVSPSPLGVHYNYPNINRLWSFEFPQPFEKGMVISYESCEGEHMVGGVRLEDMVVVTENGPELIDLFPRDEITVI